VTHPTIILPAQFNGTTLSQVAADVLECAQEQSPTSLIFDFSRLRFIRPAGVVFLSNLAYWLNEHGTKVSFVNCDTDRIPIKYLDDSLFFEQHCGGKLDPNSGPRPTTRPLVRIAQEESHAWLETNLVRWLAGRLSITEPSLYAFKACISELFNNIQDHTRYDIGSIFVQHFPNDGEVTISVSDFGLGIPEKVREKEPDLADSDAIIRAVQEGFTTKSRPSNKGAGLDYLLRVMVLNNGGRVTVYSGKGIVCFEKSGTNIRPVVFPDVGFCPGTTIDITLQTDTIEELPEEREDLEW
jgi:anti-sigma regulatory factor (Ser/Thr protein kinase)